MKSQETAEHVSIPDYLEYFGLDADPFEAVCPAFFEEGSRGDQFSQLLHLTQFSDALLGVVGGEGLGKKTFQQELIERLDPDDIVVEVKASLLNDSYGFINEVVKKFGLDTPLPDQKPNNIEAALFELIHVLREYGNERTENDALKILIVEDAHHLDDQALKALTSLSVHQLENQRSIHLVLFGDVELSDRLIELENEKLLVQVFELEPFSKEELKHYLRFRLDAVGFEGIFPYKSDDIDFLWDVSRGVPAETHDAARDILIELASPPPESKPIGLPIPHMALVVVLVAGLLAALFYRSNSADQPEDVEVALVPQAKTKTINIAQPKVRREGILEEEPSNIIAPTIEGSISGDQDSGFNSRVPTKPLIQDQDKLVKVKKESEVVSESSVMTEPLPPSEVIKPRGNDESLVSTPSISEVKPKNQAARTPSVSSTEDDLIARASRSKLTQDESLLMSKSDSSVTLQLLAGASLEAAEKFISRQQNKQELSIYSAMRNGKELFIVVGGNYPTSELARDAIKRLPDELQKAGPWPRQLSSVKDDIRQFRGL